MHTLQVKLCGLIRVIKHEVTAIWVAAVPFTGLQGVYDVVLNWSELWHERNSENGFHILSLPLVLQLGQCPKKDQEHHFLSIEFKMVRKKESTPQWRIMSKFASFKCLHIYI